MPVTWWAERAWRGGDGCDDGVLFETEGERIVAVQPGIHTAPPGAAVLRGVVLPGLANVHSHCFHRALRARTEELGGSFWSWREAMYAVADRLEPDTLFTLARAVYAEMALAGITCVGEFHYLHHGRGGRPYDAPNAMGEAVLAAAAEAGIRITLLDTCYLAGGIGEPLAGTQKRFGDGDAVRWGERAAALRCAPHARVGAAIHSVRAVPAEQLGTVVAWAAERGAPLHVHVSEQPAENEACLAALGCTPTALLGSAGVLGPRTTAVHATHVSDADIALLGGSGTVVCVCPTTERDLGDGIGPARALAAAGAPLVVGSDSHSVIDLLEEARAIELDERLRSGERGHWRTAALLDAATSAGHAAVGWPEAGRLEVGALADFVSVRLDTPRAAGATAATVLQAVVFAATAADVTDVVVGGRRVVAAGRHRSVDDVAGALSRAIAAVADR